jgi:hypothetical protein
VETVTVADVGEEPFKVKELGDIEHVESAGAPLQLKVTARVNPPSGTTLSEYVALAPGVTVAVDKDGAKEKPCPLPESAIVKGLFALSVTVSVPGWAPPCVGSKDTPIEQLDPAANVLPQALTTPNAAELDATLEIVTPEVPLLVNVTVCEGPELPTY